MQKRRHQTFSRFGLVALGLLVIAETSVANPARAANGTLTATYSISIAGIPIGRADAVSKFQGSGYALSINGSTSGISRLVSDATAQMESVGRVYGQQLLVGSYALDTKESGLITRVRMRLTGGSVVDVSASPPLAFRAGRVPITQAHKQNVVDPISAFMVPANGTIGGQAACGRTVRVFDGWQRFDIRLFFKEERQVEGETGSASKSVFVCGARYVPVSGHDASGDGVKFMADNKNIEIWLTQVAQMGFLIPYRIQIGTQVGDLTIRATSISTGEPASRASVTEPPKASVE